MGGDVEVGLKGKGFAGGMGVSVGLRRERGGAEGTVGGAEGHGEGGGGG
jgi:hypothetical protein